ncbi:MAG: YpdA family putative bacillithiol disulfide reductase [Sphingobacteriaceae bacterium]
MILDVLIIGSGPIGLACGLEAKKSGLSYLIVEKGCLVNSLYNYPANMTFFSTSEKIEIGGIPFVSNNIKPTRAEALEYYRRVALSNQLKIHLFEKVITNISKNDHYQIKTDKAIYDAKNVIICTGFYDIPNLLYIPGEEMSKVSHYYREPHFYALQKVLIVGASNSAVDAALETYRKGADVTMVIRESEISDMVKYWVRPDVINRIKEGSIKVFFNSRLKAVRENEADLETPDGLVTLQNDFVLALTGYQPDFSFLRKMGVRLSEDEKLCPQYNLETMETSQLGLYLAGVVCGGMDTHLWFIENSREHAEKIVKHIVEKASVFEN